MFKLFHVPEYSSIYYPGHPAIQGIFSSDVLIEEKIDGSHFSFTVDPVTGELFCRSSGKQVIVDAPDKLFEKAVETAKSLKEQLVKGWVYRGEYLEKPQHNTLKYDRIPNKYIILYDVMIGLETYLPYELKKIEADRLGLEVVPKFYEGRIDDIRQLEQYLERKSILGDVLVEGIVVKNYNVFTSEKKVALLKYVSEDFKETHRIEWRKNNPTQGDIVKQMIQTYKTEARWRKAVQHIKEAGQLNGTYQDIGLLIKEIPADVKKECEEEIKEKLFAHFWPQIQRGITAGFPEWYKQYLEEGVVEKLERGETT